MDRKFFTAARKNDFNSHQNAPKLAVVQRHLTPRHARIAFAFTVGLILAAMTSSQQAWGITQEAPKTSHIEATTPQAAADQLLASWSVSRAESELFLRKLTKGYASNQERQSFLKKIEALRLRLGTHEKAENNP